MIHYARIIMACAGELWAIDEAKLNEISAFLLLKAEGGDVSAEDVARITMKTEREIAASSGDVAILPVYGTLAQRMNMMMDTSGGTSTMQLAGAFRAALADPGVKAIVFDHNSPGGTVAGGGELAEEILHSRGTKPIIAQVNSLAASMSYWLAAMADEIVVTPGGEAGALGVYRVHEDVSKMLEQKGIKPTIIKADGAPHKVEDADIVPLSEEAFQHHKARVNQQFDRMVRAIAAGRGRSLTDVRENFGKGRMFGAEELVARGMADRIDTLEGTLERFGSGTFNPIAKANRERAQARAEEEIEITSSRAEFVDVLREKIRAGGSCTPREWEKGLRGLGLTRSEAEVAVKRYCKGLAQGEPGKSDGPSVTVADLAEMRSRLDDMLETLKRRA